MKKIKNRLTDNDSGKSAKCVRCDEVVKRMKTPFQNNFEGGVDVLFYPFYGSECVTRLTGTSLNRNQTVTAKWGVMCDGCYKGIK